MLHGVALCVAVAQSGRFEEDLRDPIAVALGGLGRLGAQARCRPPRAGSPPAAAARALACWKHAHCTSKRRGARRLSACGKRVGGSHTGNAPAMAIFACTEA
eukprot:1191457-Pleurochrysis_carterae.AAC.1